MTSRTCVIQTVSRALCLALSTPSSAHVSAASKSSRYSYRADGSLARRGVGCIAASKTLKSAFPWRRSRSPVRMRASASAAAFLNLAGFAMCVAMRSSAVTWSAGAGAGAGAGSVFARLGSGSSAGGAASTGRFAEGRSSNRPMARRCVARPMDSKDDKQRRSRTHPRVRRFRARGAVRAPPARRHAAEGAGALGGRDHR